MPPDPIAGLADDLTHHARVLLRSDASSHAPGTGVATYRPNPARLLAAALHLAEADQPGDDDRGRDVTALNTARVAYVRLREAYLQAVQEEQPAQPQAPD